MLTEAATLGLSDVLHGFKENVIMGHLIPAGTGYPSVLQIELTKVGEEIKPEFGEERAEAPDREADAAKSRAKALLGL